MRSAGFGGPFIGANSKIQIDEDPFAGISYVNHKVVHANISMKDALLAKEPEVSYVDG